MKMCIFKKLKANRVNLWHICYLGVLRGTERYAGIAVPQVLQYLREFDAPAMQSCKPLPCGIGSCQNRRLREQTPKQKTMSLWQHQGRLMYGTPNISRPATAGTHSLRLS